MLRKIRIPLTLLLAVTLASSAVESFSQLGPGDGPQPQPTDGVYLIKRVTIDDGSISAENVESKISVAAAFTFDPVPGSSAQKPAKHKKGRKGHKKAPEEAPKVVPSHDCKAWMIHVNWSPRVGDKVKIADAGQCHLKGSFAGR